MVAVKAQHPEKLVRKQFLVSNRQVNKLSLLSESEGKSEAEIVRLAIDAFDPRGMSGIETPELMELVSNRLNEALLSTRKASAIVATTLEALDGVKG